MSHIDDTLSKVENNRFFKKYIALIRYFDETSTLEYYDIVCLLLAYHKFALENGSKTLLMRPEQLHSVFTTLFNFTDQDFIMRIIYVISDDPKFVSPQAWLLLFRVFLSGDLSVRIRFAFDMYDKPGLGYLNTEHVGTYVDKFFQSDDEDLITELRADMVELLFQKFDLDRDGTIDFSEYEQVVLKQPDLLEFLGQVFPSKSQIYIVAHCLNIESSITFDKRSPKRRTLFKHKRPMPSIKSRKSEYFDQKWFG